MFKMWTFMKLLVCTLWKYLCVHLRKCLCVHLWKYLCVHLWKCLCIYDLKFQVKIFAPNSLQPPPRNIFCVAEFRYRYWWVMILLTNCANNEKMDIWQKWWCSQWLCFSYQAQRMDELCLSRGENTLSRLKIHTFITRPTFMIFQET